MSQSFTFVVLSSSLELHFFFLLFRRSPRVSLFPYTTLFRAPEARAWRMTARARAMPAATRPSHHSACPPKNRPAMPSGEVNGVQDRIFAVRPDAPRTTGAKNPPTVMTPMVVAQVDRALDPTTVDAQTRSAKTDHAVSSSVRANQPSPGSMAKAREVLPDSDSPSSVTTAAATRWMTTSDRVPVIRPEAEARGGIVAAMIS